MAQRLPQVPIIPPAKSLKELNDAVQVLLDYLLRLKREIEKALP